MKTPTPSAETPSLNSKSKMGPPVAIAGPDLPRSDGVSSGLVIQRPIGSTASDAAIAARAYEKFVARGKAHGHDREDWVAAKRELQDGTRKS